MDELIEIGVSDPSSLEFKLGLVLVIPSSSEGNKDGAMVWMKLGEIDGFCRGEGHLPIHVA